MADAYSMPGTLWPILLGILAFALVFVLKKVGWLKTEEAVLEFSNKSAIAVAAVAAIGADGGSGNLVLSLLGRVAIFGLVWFVGGLFFTLGAAIALEKMKR